MCVFLSSLVETSVVSSQTNLCIQHVIHVIDFGLGKKYINRAPGEHIPYVEVSVYVDCQFSYSVVIHSIQVITPCILFSFLSCFLHRTKVG